MSDTSTTDTFDAIPDDGSDLVVINQTGGESTADKAAQTVSNAADAFTTFVKERPLTAAAGGIALGILVAGIFKGPRSAAVRGGSKAVGLAAIGAEIASAFASELLDDAKDAGREGARRAEDFGDAVGDKARSLRRDAGYKANRTQDAARIASRETGKRIARALGRR